MSSAFSSYAVCRVTLAFVWLYQGLVPKWLYLHEDELAISLSAGLSHDSAVQVAMVGGLLEIVMAVGVLVFWRQRWPLELTAFAMATLLVLVALVKFELLIAAFNPVITNIMVISLSIVALQLHPARLSGRNDKSG